MNRLAKEKKFCWNSLVQLENLPKNFDLSRSFLGLMAALSDSRRNIGSNWSDPFGMNNSEWMQLWDTRNCETNQNPLGKTQLKNNKEIWGMTWRRLIGQRKRGCAKNTSLKIRNLKKCCSFSRFRIFFAFSLEWSLFRIVFISPFFFLFILFFFW